MCGQIWVSRKNICKQVADKRILTKRVQFLVMFLYAYSIRYIMPLTNISGFAIKKLEMFTVYGTGNGW